MNRVIMTRVFVALIIGCGLEQSIQAQTTNSPWPVFQHDVRHAGRSEYAGPSNGVIAWSVAPGSGYSVSAPVLGSTGMIYIGSSDSSLYAIRPNGTLRWKCKANAAVSTPCVGAEGSLFFASAAGTVYAVREDGSQIWSYSCGYPISAYGASLVLDAAGNLYFGSDEKKIYALNSDGSLKWGLDVLGVVQGTPAIGPDGTMYFSTRFQTKVYAVSSDGKLKWKYDMPSYDPYITSIVVGEDSTIYAGTGWPDNKVYAIRSGGTLKWTYSIGSGFVDITGPPALGADGTIYLGSEDNNLHALYPNGSLKWKLETGGDIGASPVIDSQGTIFFGSADGKLYALKPDGTIKWTFMGTGGIFAHIVIDSTRTLYITSGSKLTAFFDVGTGTPDLALSASDISFSPTLQSVRGTAVTITSNVREISRQTSARFTVSFFQTDKSHLIDTVSTFVLPGSSTTAEIVWNSEGLPAGTYPIIVKVSRALPAEKDTSNNEAQTNYTLLRNLQDRIDVAVMGDTVWVDPGIYYGLVTLKKGVVVRSRMGPTLTIIDGQGKGTVVSAPHLDKTAVLDGFTITNGDGTSGGGVGIERGGVTIRNCIITGNKAAWGGGVYMIGSFVEPDPLVEYNVITRNEATWGDALYANNSWGMVKNNTIVANGGGSGDGVNAIGYYSDSPTILNCIVWGNGDDLSGTAKANFSCIQNGDSGTGNISVNPQFADTAMGNYRLSKGSPCIDAGDPASPADPDGSRADMGAFPYTPATSATDRERNFPPREYGLSQNYPNPFNPATVIRYALPARSRVTLTVYNTLGQIVRELVNGEIEAGNHSVQLDASNLASGVYFYRLQAGSFVETKKALLIR